MASDYVLDGRALTKSRPVDEHVLTFRAESVRQERTGVHALVRIGANGSVLAWSNFNVERDEDRVRLANSAYTHLNGLKNVYAKELLKNDLDQFCSGLWDAQIAHLAPVMMEGTLKAAMPAFLLYPFVLAQGGTIIFAPPGRGKSYTLMMMAVVVDAGLQTVWQPVKHCRVLFINLERSQGSVADRLGNINGALGLVRSRPIATINARGKSLLNVAAAAERYIGDEGIELVVVDSISRAGAGTLNADDNVNRVCDTLNGLGPAWVGLAHTPRADESHLYGSVMFEAAADVVVQLLSQQDEDGPLGVGLQITKQNDIGRTPMWTMALEFCETGLSRVRNAKVGEFPDIEAARKMTMRDKVRQHLEEIKEASASEIAEDLGLNRSNVANLLSSDKWFKRLRKLGRETMYGLAPIGESEAAS